MCIWYISLKWTVAPTEWSFSERLLDSSNRRKINTVSISNRSWLTRLWLNPVENSNANTHSYLLCCPNWGWWKLSAALARYSASLAPLGERSTFTRACVHPRTNARQGVGEIRWGRGPQSPGSSCLDEGFEKQTPKIRSQYLPKRPRVGPPTLCVSCLV